MSVAQINYLDRFLNPVTQMMPPEALERIVNFKFDEATQSRSAELAEKANEGLLTEDESSEYAEYIEAVDLIGIIQASARSILAKKQP